MRAEREMNVCRKVRRVGYCVATSGELYAGSATNDGTLLPDGTASGGRCHEWGGDVFEEVTFAPSD